MSSGRSVSKASETISIWCFAPRHEHGVNPASVDGLHHAPVAPASGFGPRALATVDLDVGEVGPQPVPDVLLGDVELAVEALLIGGDTEVTGDQTYREGEYLKKVCYVPSVRNPSFRILNVVRGHDVGPRSAYC